MIRDVAARPREAGDDARGNSVADAHHDDGYRCGSLLGRKGSRCASGHEDVNLEPDQLGRQVGEAIKLPSAQPGLDDNVLPLHVAQITQALPQ